jgi:signal transduction histidine kinase
VKLALESPPPDVNVWVDADRLLQVLTNLMSNAAKHSPPSESVLVAVEASESHVRILVKDRGPGVAPEFRGRIFQRFAQADTMDSRRRSGSGLGLSISKALIERMARDLAYYPHPGPWAVFYVRVPRPCGDGTTQREPRDEAR